MSADRYDNAVVDSKREIIGYATRWNPYGLGECIVQYIDGSASSMFFNELVFANGSHKASEYLNEKERRLVERIIEG